MSDVLKKALRDAEGEQSLVGQKVRDLKRASELLTFSGSVLTVTVTGRRVAQKERDLSLSPREMDGVCEAIAVELKRQAVELAAVHRVTLEVGDVE